MYARDRQHRIIFRYVTVVYSASSIAFELTKMQLILFQSVNYDEIPSLLECLSHFVSEAPPYLVPRSRIQEEGDSMETLR